MTVLEQQPLTLSIPLYEDPPGVLRVGKSRVMLELVIHAFQRGETPERIVQSYDTLSLPDIYAVVSYYLANPTAVDDYPRQCDVKAEDLSRKIESSQAPRKTRGNSSWTAPGRRGTSCGQRCIRRRDREGAFLRRPILFRRLFDDFGAIRVLAVSSREKSPYFGVCRRRHVQPARAAPPSASKQNDEGSGTTAMSTCPISTMLAPSGTLVKYWVL